jgi:chromosome segregation ATPase
MDEEVVDVAVVVEEPALPAKPKGSLATRIGKGITLANFIISLLFVATAFFFYSQKVQVRERKSQLDQTTRELTTLGQDRQAIVDGLKQEIETENQRLANVVQEGTKNLATLDASIVQIRQQIENSRRQQSALSDEADGLQKDQASLIAEIQNLRDQLETTLGQKEAEIAQRVVLEDLLAKTLNDLREASRRQKEVARRVAP